MTKRLGELENNEWNLDSIMTRNIRILDSIKSTLSKWNSEYNYISKEFSENKQPSDEDLEKIEEYKKNGWI